MPLNTPIGLLALHEHAQALLDCVCESMDSVPTEMPGFMGCPCRRFVSPGQPVADACDDGCGTLGPGEWPGQLTVHIDRMFPTDYKTFPRRFSNAIGGNAAVRDLKNCLLPQVNALDLTITVFRCMPIHDGTCPPEGDDLSAVAMQLSVDMLAVQRAVMCCYPASDTTVSRNGRRYTMGDTNMIGPSGGCMGFRTSVTVAVDGCLPCPPEEP